MTKTHVPKLTFVYYVFVFFLTFGYIKLDRQVAIISGTVGRLNCRALRLSAPTSRHCTRDSHREHPQGIQHVDSRDQRVRARLLVELEGGQAVHRARCRSCEQADESIPSRAARFSANSPGKWHICSWYTLKCCKSQQSSLLFFEQERYNLIKALHFRHFCSHIFKLFRQVRPSWHVTWTRPTSSRKSWAEPTNSPRSSRFQPRAMCLSASWHFQESRFHSRHWAFSATSSSRLTSPSNLNSCCRSSTTSASSSSIIRSRAEMSTNASRKSCASTSSVIS